jgi:hypothetical protein
LESELDEGEIIDHILESELEEGEIIDDILDSELEKSEIRNNKSSTRSRIRDLEYRHVDEVGRKEFLDQNVLISNERKSEVEDGEIISDHELEEGEIPYDCIPEKKLEFEHETVQMLGVVESFDYRKNCNFNEVKVDKDGFIYDDNYRYDESILQNNYYETTQSIVNYQNVYEVDFHLNKIHDDYNNQIQTLLSRINELEQINRNLEVISKFKLYKKISFLNNLF